jgi:hypothetical protein
MYIHTGRNKTMKIKEINKHIDLLGAAGAKIKQLEKENAQLRKRPAVNEKLNWEGDLDDDCSLSVGELFAHCECLADDIKCSSEGEEWTIQSWFVGVYRRDGQPLFHSGEVGGMITSGEMARAIAEAIIN